MENLPIYEAQKPFSEKPKGYSQQITDFRKSVSRRKFYAPLSLTVSPIPSSPPLAPPPLPPPSLLLYCYSPRLIITEKEIQIDFNKAKVSTNLLQT